MSPGHALARSLTDLQDRTPGNRWGVAVSGGSDSVALLTLLCDWAHPHGIAVAAATVDHGLRPESRTEADWVARLCAGMGVPHRTLTWRGWDGTGNLQAAARDARRALLTDWASAGNLSAVLTGHTRDDQAETVLLRLARGSGVDGLGAMAPTVTRAGLTWARPLLEVGRDDLQAWLRGRGQGWLSDPSNADERFDRVRARKLAGALADLGLTSERLAATAGHMRAASQLLRTVTADFARHHCRVDRGDVVIDRRDYLSADPELVARILSAALCWVSGQAYRPRFSALEGLMRDIAEGRGGTLHGCLARPRGGDIRVTREHAAVRDCAGPVAQPWDGRWHLSGPDPAAEIRALGDAVGQVPGWQDCGLPRESLLSSPSVWKGSVLLAAPLAGMSAGWTAILADGRDDFTSAIIVH